MLDKNFVLEKINLISQDVKGLEQFSDFTISQMAGDYVRYHALKNILMEIIGRAIDVNQHLLLELLPEEKDIPKTYKETFISLGKLKVFPEDFALEISKSAGFRNAIVHEYNNLDKGIVYSTVGQAIDQYAKYCDYILRFLKK